MSIRGRLTLYYTGVLAVVVVALGAGLYLWLGVTLRQQVDRGLEEQTDAILKATRLEVSLLRSLVRVQLPDLDIFSAPDVVVQVISPEGAVLARSVNLGRQKLPVDADFLGVVLEDGAAGTTFRAGGEEWRLYGRTLVVAGESLGVLQVARSLRPIQDALSGLARLLAVSCALGILAAFGLGWVLAGAALRPVDRLTREAAAIGARQDFSRRVSYEGPPDELGQLSSTLNEMLGRLEDAYAAQRRFAADASHELRTPLTVIRGNVAYLRNPETDPMEREAALADISSEVDRMARLVEGLLTLARADAGQHLELGEVELQPLLYEVGRGCARLGDAVGVPVEVSGLETVEGIRLRGNADALKQLLFALVDNAVKFSPPGGRVHVTTEVEPASVALNVSDAGPGIRPEEVERIWDRFYRGDTARGSPGAGLGLAIAGWIAREHGGRIEVSSQEGLGTRFTVRLPRGAV